MLLIYNGPVNTRTKTSAFDPFPQLETPNLILRQMRPGDKQAIFDIFSDGEVARYTDSATFTTLVEAETMLREVADLTRGGAGARWGITRRDDDTVIGTCGYHQWSRHNSRAEIGYDLQQAHWRQGIMTEALQAMLTFGFDHMALNRIEALALPDNVASSKLLETLGFRAEGVLREYDFFRDEFNKLRMFSLLKREYQNL